MLVLGALVIFVFVISASAISAWRLARSVERADAAAARAHVANVAARAGFSPAAVSGARLAFERGSAARAVPVLSSFAGLTIAVAAVVGAVTFGAGLNHLRASPRLVGWNWDIVTGYPDPETFSKPVPPAEVYARTDRALRDAPGVADFAAGSFWPVFSNGQPILVGAKRVQVDSPMAFDGAARVGPSVISGHKPSSPDEILLGPDSLAEVGARIGDEVEVSGQGTWEEPTRTTSARVRIVGTGVLPTAAQLGHGSAMTVDGLARLAPGVLGSAIYVRLTPGTGPQTVVDALTGAFPEAPPATSCGASARVPVLISALGLTLPAGHAYAHHHSLTPWGGDLLHLGEQIKNRPASGSHRPPRGGKRDVRRTAPHWIRSCTTFAAGAPLMISRSRFAQRSIAAVFSESAV